MENMAVLGCVTREILTCASSSPKVVVGSLRLIIHFLLQRSPWTNLAAAVLYFSILFFFTAEESCMFVIASNQ